MQRIVEFDLNLSAPHVPCINWNRWQNYLEREILTKGPLIARRR